MRSISFGVTGSPALNAASLKQARRLLKGFGGVFTGTLLGRKWAENRFRFPYLRHALWEAGYVVDTLETATDWANVGHLLDKVEASLRDGLAAQGERVEVAARTLASGGVEITVDDDGPGIPAEQHEEAFKAFARLDESRNQNTKGVGLGLAIARDVARGHGGDITLDRSPLGGEEAPVIEVNGVKQLSHMLQRLEAIRDVFDVRRDNTNHYQPNPARSGSGAPLH